LALGDSYTIGEGVEPEDGWPVRLAALLLLEGFVITDSEIVARTGWTTDELGAGIDRAGLRGTYDLVSLLEDARRDVPAELRRMMIERYLAAFPALDRSAFLRSAAILAVQRNCKILGIFTRLWKRDGKSGYLVHIPRIWRLLEQDLDHPALGRITQWLDRNLPREARSALDVRGAA